MALVGRSGRVTITSRKGLWGRIWIINDWTVLFDVLEKQLKNVSAGTFIVQVAGAKTAAGNLLKVPIRLRSIECVHDVVVNEEDLEPWTIA